MSDKLKTQLLKSETVAENTIMFAFAKPEGFTYRAGQTIHVTLTSPQGTEMVHTFSLVSAPEDTNLAIATRIRDSEYKKALKDLHEGAEVLIDGPYGSFFLHQDDSRPAVFLVGGIGVTPFMSMIRDARASKLPHSIYLFYSNKSVKDAPFFEELNSYAQEDNATFTFIPTMTDIENSTETWNGERGYIDWNMVTKHISEPENAVYYMAGPKGMVNAMRTLLTEHDISEDSIRSEEFSGY